ncbi:hypothetical protein DPMN_113311 [Dreissena polymorpha]|uniref:Uncharacterized protein n=1 Tax=Dreissena polymorpha TaxID=45954 RepID=A0A9D4KH90_DREPO|nr:hypothetical protein DPMN_113311 [Dreissena polymorpha]
MLINVGHIQSVLSANGSTRNNTDSYETNQQDLSRNGLHGLQQSTMVLQSPNSVVPSIINDITLA